MHPDMDRGVELDHRGRAVERLFETVGEDIRARLVLPDPLGDREA
jgi:hypothetical protein